MVKQGKRVVPSGGETLLAVLGSCAPPQVADRAVPRAYTLGVTVVGCKIWSLLAK